MISFKSMQSHVDNAYSRAKADMDDAIESAEESPSVEDLQAFNDASQQASVANIINNESLRANHSITKAIIDGIHSEFAAILAQWCERRSLTPLDCWIDDANARLAVVGNGVRLSLDLLDPYDAGDPQRIEALLGQGGASVACACDGALAIDPESRCMVLLSWLPDPCDPARLLDRLESLANQRAAMLSLMQTSMRNANASSSPRATLNTWQAGV